MDQIRKLIAALTIRQRISIGTVVLLVIGGIFALTHQLKEGDFKPLYTSLAPEDAAAVIQKLKESGTEYRVADGGATVLAPSSRVAELRLDLAAAGVPKTGRIGYELFDKTNLGATEFTEQLNYHRALEGELERSIGAISAVEQSRVHLTFSKESVFLESRQPAKASVLLKLRVGAPLTPRNVSAVANLVASAVEGLTPDAVSILDMRGNLLSRPHRALDADQPSEVTLEYREKIEHDLLTKVNSTLEPLLGPERFRAGVSVECDFASGEQSEETLDPNKSVMVTSQKSEEQTGSNSASGQPGTTSALPRPTSRPGSGSAGLSRRTENIAFQSSRVVRHMKIPQGTVKRMSISVLVDHSVRFEGVGVKAKRIVTPPPPETLKVIHDIVAAATGFSAERGDQLVIEALPFETTRNFEPSSNVGDPSAKKADPRIPKFISGYVQDFSVLLMAAGAAAVFVLFFLGVLFLMFKKKKPAPEPEVIPAIAGAEPDAPPALTAEERKAQLSAQLAAQIEEQDSLQRLAQQQLEADATRNLRIPIATTKKGEILIKHIRENVGKDVEATANVLRTWLADMERHSKSL